MKRIFGKKRPILTATTCSIMEMIRTALEVLFGKHIAYVCIDLNTNEGKIRADNEIFEMAFRRRKDDLFDIIVRNWCYCVLFEKDGLIKIGPEDAHEFTRITSYGEFTMRWVGRSNTERWQEPLFIEDAMYCAEIHGLTLEQLLNN